MKSVELKKNFSKRFWGWVVDVLANYAYKNFLELRVVGGSKHFLKPDVNIEKFFYHVLGFEDKLK